MVNKPYIEDLGYEQEIRRVKYSLRIFVLEVPHVPPRKHCSISWFKFKFINGQSCVFIVRITFRVKIDWVWLGTYIYKAHHWQYVRTATATVCCFTFRFFNMSKYFPPHYPPDPLGELLSWLWREGGPIQLILLKLLCVSRKSPLFSVVFDLLTSQVISRIYCHPSGVFVVIITSLIYFTNTLNCKV